MCFDTPRKMLVRDATSLVVKRAIFPWRLIVYAISFDTPRKMLVRDATSLVVKRAIFPWRHTPYALIMRC
jgi:hypothetical protein